MNKFHKKYSQELIEHFFRNEYGKIVSVITRYIGTENVETAEDIVQETLLKAVDSWQQNGLPEKPNAWLYTTAKNLTLNILKRKQHHIKYKSETRNLQSSYVEFENLQISEEMILDEQLKMMFVCCHSSISENSQIALILKILCGFSIAEIANAFFSTNETINKRLVRGRKQLRENKVSFEIPQNINENLTIILRTIYLLFNEGYSPSNKNEIIRYDLCLEAIRLTEIIISSKYIKEKADSYALIALMYLNISRFESRTNKDNSLIEMDKQDRNKWNKELIAKGIHNLNLGISENKVSSYHILAAISANHCTAQTFEQTNWKEILSLYDKLLLLQNSPIIELNRCVALSKIKGNEVAINELLNLNSNSDIGNYYLFQSTIAEFYKLENKIDLAIKHFNKAISLSANKRDKDFLEKKLKELVPIS
ncbi:MAG: sigma-70 family RNA polymerase sigma factor [Melioribacteraceae bacterium]